MKKILLISIGCFLFSFPTFSQKVGIRTNLLYLATTNLNLGIDVGLGYRTSFEVSGVYNPFRFGDNKKIENWGVQPEFRIWTCERYNGHFFGIHAHYDNYDMGWKKYRYDGWLAGGGISYGYSWIIGKRWNLEAELGVGYAYMDYDKYFREQQGKPIMNKTRNYIGPTKVGLSFIWFIK
ncbi:MAG TPA: DUF3575 domain-containing protein [Candidatus Avirikenella pullistercoris]|nr:DUF3575 domain-containing protein [Candidatus Avirikenella pullistercoris]